MPSVAGVPDHGYLQSAGQRRKRHESTASRGAQRRTPLQEEVVAGSGTGATGGLSVSPVGEPAEARSAGGAGPAESNHH